MYSEQIIRRAIFEESQGVRIGGRMINNLRYADDTTILTEDEDEMKELLRKLKEESEKAGLMLNLNKTKIMTTGMIRKFQIDGTEIEVTNEYNFLGSLITKDGYSRKEINRRISIGRTAVTKLDKIIKDKDISVPLKVKLIETLVFPTVTYGSESWTVLERDRKRIDAFELWKWRKLLRISWTEKRTNKSVLEDIKPTRSLEAMVVRRKLQYFGHVMRNQGSLEHDIMIGQVEGSRKQGKPRTRWIDDVKKIVNLSWEAITHIVKDRKEWRKLTEVRTMNRERTNVH